MLDLINIPYTSIAKGVRFDVDPLDLDPSQSPDSVNFVHYNGSISLRPGTAEYRDFSGKVDERADPFTIVYLAAFDNGDTFLVTANRTGIWTFDGGGWTNRTGSLTLDGGNFVPWDAAFGIDNNLGQHGTVFLANGGNRVLWWDGSSAPFSEITSSGTYRGPTDLEPRHVAVHDGRLVMANIVEADQVHRARIRFSQVSEFDNFDVTAGAHAYDLLDTPGPIVGLARLGDVLYALKEDAIVMCQSTGDPIMPYIFPYWISRGCIAGRSFAAISPFAAMYLGRDNIYLLSGQDAQPVGDPIVSDLFSRLNHRRLELVVAHAFPDRSIYRLWIPVGEEDYPTRCYAFNWQEKTWWVEEWPGEVHSVGVSTLGEGTLIDDLTDTIDSYSDEIIDDWGPEDKSPIVVVGAKYDSGDYRLASLTNGHTDMRDGGKRMISAWWTSKDIMPRDPGTNLVLRRVDVHLDTNSDGKMRVSVSTDRGHSWKSHVASFEKGKSIVSTWWNMYGPYFRVRIQLIVETEEITSLSTVHIAGVEARILQRGRRH